MPSGTWGFATTTYEKAAHIIAETLVYMYLTPDGDLLVSAKEYRP